ncbi:MULTISPECIES: hypothetical protein [unclassified Campylobacter]|uniref:hypothetical protein n=1 Tax=unclassified Campylobacter TaxID=2593542 RepID=UPI000EA97902|nr:MULTISPECIES: hypothetical protein [unclassified Campylobacter]QOR01654.1 hypothetical protein A0083_02585 [Campylobacter sp. 2014D-0216]RKO64238.1 hypothetical protein CKA54_06500 [Campylobacter sp. P255]
MNQELSNILISCGLILKNTKSIDLSSFSKKKKILCLYGENTKKEYCLVLFSFVKSKILAKDSLEYERIIKQISTHLDLNFKNSFIFHQALICSKAKAYLNNQGIKTHAFV